MMIWIRMLFRAIADPSPAPVDTSLWRRFLAKRRVFDVISATMQLAQMRRILRLPVPPADDVSPRANTIRHNLSQIVRKPFTRSRRVEPFYQIATTPYRDVSGEKVLIIGARAIHEFFEATLYGFSWANIVGADLLSAHPKMIEMDMHSLKFESGTFDVVMMINTLGYSETPETAISEAMRVLKPGGRFVFNHAYRGSADRFSQTAILRADDIIAMLRRHGGRIFFHDEFDKINSEKQIQTSHMYGAIKRDPAVKILDTASL
jgi:SAM-dependent methyltransferase